MTTAIFGLIVVYIFYRIIVFHASESRKELWEQHWFIQAMVRTIDKYRRN